MSDEPKNGAKQPFHATPITMPGAKLIAVGVAAIAAVVALATVVVWMLRPGAVPSAAMGAVPAAIGVVLGVLIVRPGVPREPAKWVTALFAAQGIGVFGVLFSAVLLYWPTRPDPLVYAMVAAGAFSSAAIVQAVVFSSHLKVLQQQHQS